VDSTDRRSLGQRLLCLLFIGLEGFACDSGRELSIHSDASAGDVGADGVITSAEAATTYGDAADGGCPRGVPRCQGNFGYQVCQDDGTWGPPQNCAGYSANGTSSYCITISGWGTCVDPACWYWIGLGAVPGPTAVGECMPDGTMKQCLAGGTLSAFSCNGVCMQVGTLDGLSLGYCAARCEDGTRECLGGPLYRVCSSGRWLDQAQACADGQPCNPAATDASSDIRCGGACDPGTSHCAADGGAIETCVAQASGAGAAQWRLDRTCLLGSCRQAGLQAQCQAECTPGQHECAYDGASTERSCDPSGTWGTESACPAATSCRSSGPAPAGCVACVGSGVVGGNAFGLSDSTCQGSDIVRCGADNRWLPSSPCGDAQTCTQLQRGPSSVASCQ
jgi:hypothetical protein